jgi:hypothetical protein
MTMYPSPRCVLLLALLCGACGRAGGDPHHLNVPPQVFSVGLERVDGAILRYVTYFPSASPCVRVELIRPTQFEVLERQDLCTFEVGPNEIVDVREDITGVDYEDIGFDEQGLRFTANLHMRDPRLIILDCRIEVRAGSGLSRLSCHRGERPTEG